MQTKHAIIIATFLILSLTTFANAYDQLISLGEGIGFAEPLSANTLICSNDENELFLLNIPDGKRKSWSGMWNSVSDGWGDTGQITSLCVSSDYKWVCYSIEVRLPEDYKLQFDGMRCGLAVVLARADGSESKCVAMGIEVGGGPEYAFTQNNTLLVGHPFLNCHPTPRGYAAFINSEYNESDIPEFNCIEVSTGKPQWINDLNVGDGFWKCPYSDNYRIENNWYAEHNFSSFATGGLTGSFQVPIEFECRVFSWVKPDAMLIEFDNQTGLLYTTGEFEPAPYYGLQVFCWLPDNSYILRITDTGMPFHASMDWETWRIEDADLLLDYKVLEWNMLIPLPNSSGILINEWGPSELLLLKLQ